MGDSVPIGTKGAGGRNATTSVVEPPKLLGVGGRNRQMSLAPLAGNGGEGQ